MNSPDKNCLYCSKDLYEQPAKVVPVWSSENTDAAIVVYRRVCIPCHNERETKDASK